MPMSKASFSETVSANAGRNVVAHPMAIASNFKHTRRLVIGMAILSAALPSKNRNRARAITL
jgi:hypothetical protein